MESSALTRFPRVWCGGALAVVTLLLGASPASAATTIGSGLAQRPNLSIGCGVPGEPNSLCTVAQTELPDRPVTAPTDGVIVRWRVRAATAGEVRLRVLRPVGNGRFSGAGTSAPTTLFKPSGPGQDQVYVSSTRLPVVQGDFIALNRERRSGAVYAQRSGDVFDTIQFDLPLPDGESEAPDTSQKGVELLLNADVEPDKDGDGYGDETQDNCPSVANDQTDNPCPSDPIRPDDPTTDDPGVDDDNEGRQFRKHRAKKRKRKKRRNRSTNAHTFRSHR